MSQKKNRRIVGVMGIWGFVLAGTGMYVPFVVAESNLSVISNVEQKDQKIHLTQKGEQENPPITQPVVPPMSDSEMVIKPETPPDPDAVVTPPVVDPEMAVDPATRQPMTPEKLDRLTPEELEKGFPDKGKKGFPDK